MKNHDIGIMLECFRKPFGESLKLAKSLGADALQINLFALDYTHAQRMEALDQIRSNGLRVVAVCGDLGGHGFTEAEANLQRLETSKRIMELAKDFEADVVTTHVGVIPEDKKEDTYGILLDACGELGRIGEQFDGHYAIETGPECPAVLRSFLDDVNSTGIGVNYDPANLVMVTASDPVAGVHTLGKYIYHTHAKDGVQLRATDPRVVYGYLADGGIEDARLGPCFLEKPLGQGNVDFEGWIKALDEIGYTGCLTVEREIGANPEADIALAVRYLREILAK